MKSCLAVVVLALASLNAHAGLQKWVDENGEVHYSDTRPNDVTETQNVRNVTGKDAANAPGGFTSKSLAEREADYKKSRQEKQDAADKLKEQQTRDEAKKNNCAAARENERTLQDSPRITTYDEKGEKSYMDDAARTRKLEETRKIISETCD